MSVYGLVRALHLSGAQGAIGVCRVAFPGASSLEPDWNHASEVRMTLDDLPLNLITNQ